MKILIIGYTGFIGQFLTKKLVQKNHQVIGLDINSPSIEQEKICENFIGDILSPDDVTKAAQGVDMIIVLAAKHHDFGVTREEFFRVNEGGVKNLLDCVSKLGIKKIIFYSSVAVYGTQEGATNEMTLPTPDTDYGESKLAAENVIHDWVNKDRNRCVIIIRPTVVFGPYNYANVYNLIDKIYRKKFLFVGNGNNIKSVAYVANLVDANIFLIERLKPGVQIFNYSDEPQMSIEQIVNIIIKYMPHGIPKIRIPLALAVSSGSVFDFLAKLTGYNFPITGSRMKKFATSTHHKSDKIRKLGFKQRIDVKEGFRRMIEWYLEKEVSK